MKARRHGSPRTRRGAPLTHCAIGAAPCLRTSSLECGAAWPALPAQALPPLGPSARAEPLHAFGHQVFHAEGVTRGQLWCCRRVWAGRQGRPPADLSALPVARGPGMRRSTTLADLLTPRLVANPFSTIRASLRRRSSDEFEDGVAHGWQSRLRWRPADSFFSALLRQGGDAGERHRRSSS